MTPTAICAFDIDAQGSARPCDVTLDGLPGQGWRWLHFDMRAPGLDAWLADTLPPLVVENLTVEQTRPRVRTLDTGLLLNLRGVNLNDGDAPEDMVALRIWATPQLVVTVRRRRIFAVDALRTQAQSDTGAGTLPATPGGFLDTLIEGLITRIEAMSLSLDNMADSFEDRVYEGGAIELPRLAPLQRQIIKLRRHLSPQTKALADLARTDSPVIADDLREDLRQSADRAQRTDEELQEVRDRLLSLSQHLEAARDARLGRNSYVLSVIAAIFLPLGFLTGLFGVNVGGIPGMGNPNGFAWLCLMTGIVAVFWYLVLRWKRWL